VPLDQSIKFNHEKLTKNFIFFRARFLVMGILLWDSGDLIACDGELAGARLVSGGFPGGGFAGGGFSRAAGSPGRRAII